MPAADKPFQKIHSPGAQHLAIHINGQQKCASRSEAPKPRDAIDPMAALICFAQKLYVLNELGFFRGFSLRCKLIREMKSHVRIGPERRRVSVRGLIPGCSVWATLSSVACDYRIPQDAAPKRYAPTTRPLWRSR